MDTLQSGSRLIEFTFVKNINSPTFIDRFVLKDIEVIPDVVTIFNFQNIWVEELDGEDWLVEYKFGLADGFIIQ